MTDLINRVIEVTAGLPGLPGQRWSTVGEEGYRIAFTVRKTGRSRPNKAEARLYNLSQAEIDYLRQPGIVLTLLAGYEGSTSLLATGDIKLVSVEHTEVDTITKVKIGNKQLEYTSTRFDRSFGPGTTSVQVIEAIREAMGIGRGSVAPLSKGVFASGISFRGTARDALNLIVGSEGGEWSIQDGALQILTSSNDPTLEPAVVLAPETGLIRVTRRKRGLDITALLHHEINPGRVLQVWDADIQGGLYIARDVVHEGDGFDATASYETRVKAKERRA